MAIDLDGDPLQFTFPNTPDEGPDWYPDASDLTGKKYTVDV